MPPENLKAEIDIEFESIDQIVAEICELLKDVGEGTPTVREKAAAGAFLAQFYNGIENVLQRILKHKGLPLPSGEFWHAELLQCFELDGKRSSIRLLDAGLMAKLGPYRKFRHVVLHSYGFELQWDRMRTGLEEAKDTASQFKPVIFDYLQ